MKKIKKDYWNYDDPVYEEAEIRANKFNFIFLGALLIIDVVILAFTLLNIFTINLNIMVPAFIASFILFAVPLLVLLFHDYIFKSKRTILKWKECKYLIYVPCYFGLLIVDIMLSHHAVLLIVIPPLMAAQYRFIRRDWFLIFVTTIATIPIIMYGSYLFGLADRNLLKLPEEDLNSFSARLEALTPSRGIDLFLHHCLPRILAIVVLDFLMAAIVQRNVLMLDRQAELNKQVSKEIEKQANLQNAVIEELASVIETRDVNTGEHVRRTKTFVSLICDCLSKEEKYKDILTPQLINRITMAAPMHDIGKIVVSDTILLKPGKLSKEEFEKIQVHTLKGGEMVKKFFQNFDDNTFYNEAYSIAMYHHEKWDGSGYPEHLKGEEIPLSARIMAIADVYDALISKRVYKEAMLPEEAFDIIVNEAAHHFDPDMINAIAKNKERFIEAAK